MNDKVEYKGYWWLPNNPDRAIAGVEFATKYLVNKKLKIWK